MARTVTIAERDFAPGSYQRTVDSFPQNVERLRVTITAPVAWPGVPADTVAKLTVLWGDGSGASFDLPGGQWLDKAGNVTTTRQYSVTVPKISGGKKNVVDGTGTFEVYQTLRAALLIEAV